jgi:4-diphosphocytidyl-2-C-methyl-D-erythritol kinase
MTLRAYAKINIGLHLLRRRPDGYRDIETVFHRIDLCDELSFAPSASVTLRSTDPSLPSDGTNLCVKAALLLRERYAVSDGAAMTLTKRIPMGAGLGGGSSDAAATLLGLAEFWRLSPARGELAALALEIGSDVPYFLGTGSAYAQGRGERLEPLGLEIPWWIAVATPDVHVSTAWAYEHSAIPPRSAGPPLKESVMEHLSDPKRYLTLVRNDFEPLILKTYPAIAAAKQTLYLAGAEFAQLTGSGSSVYGLFREESHARAALGALADCRTSLTAPGFRPG